MKVFSVLGLGRRASWVLGDARCPRQSLTPGAANVGRGYPFVGLLTVSQGEGNTAGVSSTIPSIVLEA